jgi:hypothetical protein
VGRGLSVTAARTVHSIRTKFIVADELDEYDVTGGTGVWHQKAVMPHFLNYFFSETALNG